VKQLKKVEYSKTTNLTHLVESYHPFVFLKRSPTPPFFTKAHSVEIIILYHLAFIVLLRHLSILITVFRHYMFCESHFNAARDRFMVVQPCFCDILCFCDSHYFPYPARRDRFMTAAVSFCSEIMAACG